MHSPVIEAHIGSIDDGNILKETVSTLARCSIGDTRTRRSCTEEWPCRYVVLCVPVHRGNSTGELNTVAGRESRENNTVVHARSEKPLRNSRTCFFPSPFYLQGLTTLLIHGSINRPVGSL